MGGGLTFGALYGAATLLIWWRARGIAAHGGAFLALSWILSMLLYVTGDYHTVGRTIMDLGLFVVAGAAFRASGHRMWEVLLYALGCQLILTGCQAWRPTDLYDHAYNGLYLAQMVAVGREISWRS